jgi:hypothetical protein
MHFNTLRYELQAKKTRRLRRVISNGYNVLTGARQGGPVSQPTAGRRRRQ